MIRTRRDNAAAEAAALAQKRLLAEAVRLEEEKVRARHNELGLGVKRKPDPGSAERTSRFRHEDGTPGKSPPLKRVMNKLALERALAKGAAELAAKEKADREAAKIRQAKREAREARKLKKLAATAPAKPPVDFWVSLAKQHPSLSKQAPKLNRDPEPDHTAATEFSLASSSFSEVTTPDAVKAIVQKVVVKSEPDETRSSPSDNTISLADDSEDDVDEDDIETPSDLLKEIKGYHSHTRRLSTKKANEISTVLASAKDTIGKCDNKVYNIQWIVNDLVKKIDALTESISRMEDTTNHTERLVGEIHRELGLDTTSDDNSGGSGGSGGRNLGGGNGSGDGGSGPGGGGSSMRNSGANNARMTTSVRIVQNNFKSSNKTVAKNPYERKGGRSSMDGQYNGGQASGGGGYSSSYNPPMGNGSMGCASNGNSNVTSV